MIIGYSSSYEQAHRSTRNHFFWIWVKYFGLGASICTMIHYGDKLDSLRFSNTTVDRWDNLSHTFLIPIWRITAGAVSRIFIPCCPHMTASFTIMLPHNYLNLFVHTKRTTRCVIWFILCSVNYNNSTN